MKKVFFVAAFLTVGIISQAQIKFGVKGGVNLSNWTGDDVEDAKMKTGVHLGGLVNIPVSTMFSVQPELLFSMAGTKFDTGEGTGTYNLSYIDVPVLLQYNNPSGFFAEAGPKFGFLAAAKAKGGGESVDIKDELKSLDLGLALGLGYKLASGLGFGARYNFGLSNVIDDGDANVKNSIIQIGLSFTFGGKK